MPLLEVRGLTRSFYGVHALTGLDLDVEAGTITGLIGPNGAGKTTAFDVITGLVPPDSGTVHFNSTGAAGGRGHITGLRPDRITTLGLVRTFQIARGFPRLSVLENLMLYGAHQPGESLPLAILPSRAARTSESELLARAIETARRLNLLRVANKPASDLSGGQRKRLEIGRALRFCTQVSRTHTAVAE